MKQTITGGLRSFVALLTLLLWGFGGLAASALELGAGRLLSAPGAPLEVEIPLLQVGEGELEVLKPQLPANSRSAELADATVELAKSSDGAAVLRVRSSAPLSADSVRFGVVADWGRGRRFREYAFSLVAGAEAAAAAAASAAPPAASPAAPT
ncbi:MAG: FimV family protein, partial [Gammaproteobacteria bacterium]